MRFTNGIWFDRENHSIYNAVEVGDLTLQDDTIRALCTIRHVKDRGDTLNKPTITVSLSSPSPGILACSATHFKGVKDQEPRFELFPDGKPDSPFVKVSKEDNAVTLEAGDLKATLSTKASSFNIAYSTKDSDVVLTDIGRSCLQYIVAPGDARTPYPATASTTIADPYYRAPASGASKPYMALSLGLDVGEHVYGLGERFGPLTKNAQSMDLWNEDAGTCTPYTYKNVPFYFTSEGYGVFFDHTSLVSLEVQTERAPSTSTGFGSRRADTMVCHPRTNAERCSRQVHIAHRPSATASTMVLWTVSQHFVPHGLQRGGSDCAAGWHARSRDPDECTPF